MKKSTKVLAVFLQTLSFIAQINQANAYSFYGDLEVGKVYDNPEEITKHLKSNLGYYFRMEKVPTPNQDKNFRKLDPVAESTPGYECKFLTDPNFQLKKNDVFGITKTMKLVREARTLNKQGQEIKEKRFVVVVELSPYKQENGQFQKIADVTPIKYFCERSVSNDANENQYMPEVVMTGLTNYLRSVYKEKMYANRSVSASDNKLSH